jgi:hypothetical protein
MPASSRPHRSEPPANVRWLLTWAVGVTLLVVLRPLSDQDLWWHLARGRAVVAGTLSPSQSLLTLDRAAEADWLGGVPFYLLWTLGGEAALACVPLLAAVGLLWFVGRRMSFVPWAAAVLGLPLALLVVRDGLQPVPHLFDLCGLVAVWALLQSKPWERGRWLAVGLVFCLWANLSAGVLYGLLLLPLFAPPARSVWKLVVAALVGGALTPRGLLTWRDAVVLFVPRAFAGPVESVPANWNGLLADGLIDSASIAFLLLWGGWVIVRLRSQRDLVVVARLAVPLMLVLLNRSHLPLAGLWVVLDWLSSPSTVPPSVVMPGRWLQAALTVTMLAAVLVEATGEGPGECRRLGWGIAQELDHRLLDVATLNIDDEHAAAWAAEARSAGVVVWVGGGVRLIDHPQRALLAGRWPLHAALRQDLLGAHRAAYRRADGGWGGFVRRLSEWNISLMFVPVEDVPLNRALTETPWRPVDLDSPTVPYASTDDEFFARPIVEALRQEGFVEAGPWQPTIDVYDSGGWRLDFAAWLGIGPQPAPAIRQSQLFRARDLPTASLRALLPVRQQSRSRRLQDEFRLCQEKLAYQEWVTFGDASLFRKRVVQSLTGDQRSPSQAPWRQIDLRSAPPSLDAWDASLREYNAGRVREAIAALPLQTDEEHYAAAMMWLELGELQPARAQLQPLKGATSAPFLLIAAEYWISQMASFGQPSSP